MGRSEYWMIKNGSAYLTGSPDAYRSEYGWTKERLLARRFLKRWQAEAYRRSCWRIVHVRIRPRSERLYLCERIRTATQRLIEAVGADGAMNLEDAVTKAVDQLEAAWAATGVAGQVRGLTTLADVIATNERDRAAMRRVAAEVVITCDFHSRPVDGKTRLVGPGLDFHDLESVSGKDLATVLHALHAAYRAGKEARSYEIRQILNAAGGKP